MTKMPELVAFMHSMIGLAAVFIAIAAVAEPLGLRHRRNAAASIPAGNRLELFIGAFVGAITFSGSVIAFGKLVGQVQVPPVPGRAGRVRRPALAEPCARDRHVCVRRVVRDHARVDCRSGRCWRSPSCSAC